MPRPFIFHASCGPQLDLLVAYWYLHYALRIDRLLCFSCSLLTKLIRLMMLILEAHRRLEAQLLLLTEEEGACRWRRKPRGSSASSSSLLSLAQRKCGSLYKHSINISINIKDRIRILCPSGFASVTSIVARQVVQCRWGSGNEARKLGC